MTDNGNGTAPQTVQQELMLIKIDAINEPKLAARATMDERKMEELMQSMHDLGQFDPIILQRDGERFEIVTGHRRFLAARDLGWSVMKAIVYEQGQLEVLAVRLHENIAREDLNPAEEAIYFREAMEKMGMDEAALVQFFHKSADYIAGRLKLWRGDPEVFNALLQKQIRLGVAHELNRVTEAGMRMYYLDAAKKSDPTVATVQGWVRDWMATVPQPQTLPVPMGPQQIQELPPGPRFECVICGGDRDPWNFVTVQVHKHELVVILKQLQMKPAAIREILTNLGMPPQEADNFAPEAAVAAGE